MKRRRSQRIADKQKTLALITEAQKKRRKVKVKKEKKVSRQDRIKELTDKVLDFQAACIRYEQDFGIWTLEDRWADDRYFDMNKILFEMLENDFSFFFYFLQNCDKHVPVVQYTNGPTRVQEEQETKNKGLGRGHEESGRDPIRSYVSADPFFKTHRLGKTTQTAS